MLAVKNSSVPLAAAGVGVNSAGSASLRVASAIVADSSSTSCLTLSPHELERLARELQPFLGRLRAHLEPFLHRAAAIGIESFANA